MLFVAFILRVSLVIYGVFHDSTYEVGYTDIDYKVFTDAARHVVNGSSPYNRHTYRYSPLIALALTPNVLLHPLWGKFLFCLIDLIVAVLIKRLVYINVKQHHRARYSMLLWLFNPLTIAISTRGNSDSLSCLLVISTLYLLQTNQPFAAGLMHGLSIHVRIYPIIHSLLFYLYFYKTPWPNRQQLRLIMGCIFSLTLLTGIFYLLYGYQFIYETYIYHLIRRDFKHNFSLYFYLQYLTAFLKPMNMWQPILINLPPLVLLLNLSKYGLNHYSLNFGVLLQTMVFVMYNKVLTSQYFVWVMGVLPLCLWQIEMTKYEVVSLVGIWGVAQCGWLLPAYLLEFQGEDTFVYVWVQSVALFCVHVGIVGRLIKGFRVPRGKLHQF